MKKIYSNHLLIFRLILLAITIYFLLNCSGANNQRPLLGGVRIECNVADADVMVDENYFGQAAAFRNNYIQLTPGRHRITLEHYEYFPEYIDVNVIENMKMSVRINMRNRP